MEPLRILVVDDERDVEALFTQKFRKQLKSGRFEIAFVNSASDALSFVKERGPDKLAMVLSDINMPGMDGLELLELLKKQYKQLKVFIITAYGDESNFNRAKALKADAFLTKPVNFKVLLEKLDNLS